MARTIKVLDRINTIREHNLASLIVTGVEDQKLAYIKMLEGDTSRAVSLHLNYARADLQAVRVALTAILQRKGRILEVMAQGMERLRQRLDPTDRAVLDQLANVRTQIATLVLKGPGKAELTRYQAYVAQLAEQAQALEAQISARSAEFRAQAQPITLEQIQQAIPAGSALVELVVYWPFNPAGHRVSEKWGAKRYAAYVLDPQGKATGVDLGNAAAIDQDIAELRRGLSDPQSTYVARVARKLDEQVMRPVRQLLGETRKIFISPDGALNLVPFGALLDEENRYLIERFTFGYLTSGRDLLRFQVKGQGQEGPMLMADPDFDSAGSAEMLRTPETKLDKNRRSTDFFAGRFEPLPGTAAEAQAIKAIFPDIKVLTGRQATESALKQVRGPYILHVATHGFFLPDLKQELGADPELQLGSDRWRRGPRTENLLLRSGLAFAGANLLKNGADDGVLTALEMASLDLWGTKLVVLSACETGVGDVWNGEGVYGLRRALVIAGSESQVLSLWKVADDATKELMVDYYGRLRSGEGRAEALRQVQLKMLTSRDWQHPFYWASFVPLGEWTNLEDKRR